VQIFIQNLQKKLPINPKKISKLISKILKDEKIKKSGFINICFVNNPLIKKYNSKFLKVKDPTDVLAFDLSEKNGNILADIMISTDIAIANSVKFNTTASYELLLYVAHGVLHILGYNDQSRLQKKLMRKKENEYVHR